MRGLWVLAGALALTACETSDDPADGGFFSGVAALSDGAYDNRIAERQARIAEGQATQADLQAELAQLNGDYDALRLQIISLRNKVTTAGKSLSPSQADRVNATLISAPGGTTEAEKIANLRRAIADARALASELTSLSG